MTMTKKTLAASTLLLIIVLFTGTRVSGGDCSTKSISIESLLQRLKEKQEPILVDVRDTREFSTFRIPGSLNIPLFALKTKTFLKSKLLVLINEGHSYKKLMDECAVLSEAGFTISILDGGLYQWKRKGGPLEGDVFAQRGLDKISPRIFLAGLGQENWIVIDASESGNPDAGHPNIRRIHIPFANSPEEFIPRLRSATEKQTNKDFMSVLLCDEKGKTYEEIERHIQAAGISNILYLEGGLEGYKAFEQRQIRLWQRKDNLGATTNGRPDKNCRSCP
jgi:rhodanese-related sulfurtransferase